MGRKPVQFNSNAAGEPINSTTNVTSNATAQNGTAAGAPANATSNTTANATALHNMLATGNPVLALLAVGAVLGGAAMITRKK